MLDQLYNILLFLFLASNKWENLSHHSIINKEKFNATRNTNDTHNTPTEDIKRTRRKQREEQQGWQVGGDSGSIGCQGQKVEGEQEKLSRRCKGILRRQQHRTAEQEFRPKIGH